MAARSFGQAPVKLSDQPSTLTINMGMVLAQVKKWMACAALLGLQGWGAGAAIAQEAPDAR